MIESSVEINELAAALAKAQHQIKGAHKNGKNSHYGSRYADLEAVWESCRDPLSTSGLSVCQIPFTKDGDIWLSTRLMHSSGQWIGSSMRVPCDKPGAHGVGSGITYAKRYMLAAMVGTTQGDDKDDDGNAAQEDAAKDVPKELADYPQEKKEFPFSSANAANPMRKPTDKMIKSLEYHMGRSPETVIVFLKERKLDSIYDLSFREASELIGKLKEGGANGTGI